MSTKPHCRECGTELSMVVSKKHRFEYCSKCGVLREVGVKSLLQSIRKGEWRDLILSRYFIAFVVGLILGELIKL